MGFPPASRCRKPAPVGQACPLGLLDRKELSITLRKQRSGWLTYKAGDLAEEVNIMKEDEFKEKLFNYLSKNISDFNIDTEVPIPYKHIYLRKNRKITLEIWCFKQDIVIYKPLFDKSVPYRGSKIKSEDKRQIQIILEKDNAQKTKDVGLPYVIIETKGRQPNTHDI